MNKSLREPAQVGTEKETNVLKKIFKECKLLFLTTFVTFFILGFFIGVLLSSSRSQEAKIAELEEQRDEMYQELIIAKDKLNQIQMRNEGIKYINEYINELEE